MSQEKIGFYFQQIEEFCAVEEAKGTEFCWKHILKLTALMNSIMREVNSECERYHLGPDFRTILCKSCRKGGADIGACCVVADISRMMEEYVYGRS